MDGFCSCNFAIEANGGIYPRDFYMPGPWRLCNIENNDVAYKLHSDKALEFICLSAQQATECQPCRWLALCRGGYWREWETGSQNLGLNIFSMHTASSSITPTSDWPA